MPESRLERTRAAYDEDDEGTTVTARDVLNYVGLLQSAVHDKFDYVTDPQTGLTTMVRRPQRFEVRR